MCLSRFHRLMLSFSYFNYSFTESLQDIENKISEKEGRSSRYRFTIFKSMLMVEPVVQSQQTKKNTPATED